MRGFSDILPCSTVTLGKNLPAGSDFIETILQSNCAGRKRVPCFQQQICISSLCRLTGGSTIEKRPVMPRSNLKISAISAAIFSSVSPEIGTGESMAVLKERVTRSGNAQEIILGKDRNRQESNDEEQQLL